MITFFRLICFVYTEYILYIKSINNVTLLNMLYSLIIDKYKNNIDTIVKMYLLSTMHI